MENKRPNISKAAFWSYNIDFETLDFNKNEHFVIKQITQSGTIEEYSEILNFYGCEKVLQYIAEQLEEWEEAKKFFKVKNLSNETMLKRLIERKIIAEEIKNKPQI